MVLSVLEFDFVARVLSHVLSFQWFFNVFEPYFNFLNTAIFTRIFTKILNIIQCISWT